MKSVLISIQPKWVGKIASGEKTIEVRKNRPNLETPFKCYIYETTAKYKTRLLGLNCTCQGRGKVIGEFVCDKMLESFLNNNDGWFIEKACLTQEEIDKYQGDNPILYGWHISDLKIYDKPKDLSEFYRPIKYDNVCGAKVVHCGHYQGIETVDFCEYNDGDCSLKGCKELRNLYQITRPPQSWCYVED